MAESAAKKTSDTGAKGLEAAVGSTTTDELPAEIAGADAAEIRARARQLENAARTVSFCLFVCLFMRFPLSHCRRAHFIVVQNFIVLARLCRICVCFSPLFSLLFFFC